MATPFIKLLQSPHGYYFFDVNRNEIVAVDEEMFVLLGDVLQGNITLAQAQKDNRSVERIVQMGYLSDHHPDKIHHGMDDSLEYYLAHKIGKITLQLTQNCNFRCRYCGYSGTGDKQRTHTNAVMSTEVALRAVDFLYEHSRDSQSVNIGLYGGEPLLEFDLITKVVEYANEKFEGKELTYSLTTNGSILQPDMVEFLLRHKVSVLISLDGPREIHDKNRRLAHTDEGTFDLIMRNLERVQKTHPTFMEQVMINMVMDPSNDADCTNQLFVDYDVFTRDRSMATIADATLSPESFDATADFLEKHEYNCFLAYMHHFKRVAKESVSSLALADLKRTLNGRERMDRIRSLGNEMAPGGPCLPGALRSFVDVHGNFFPCERCSETASVMRIGSLDEGYDLESAKRILDVGALTERECRNCWAIARCTICASQIADGDTLSIEKKKEKCKSIRNVAAYDLLNYVMLHEVERAIHRQEEVKAYA